MTAGGIAPGFRRRLARPATLLCLLVLAACTPHKSSARPPASPSPALTGSLQIFADATLDPAIQQLASAFATANPGVQLLPVRYGGTQALMTAIQQGQEGDTPDVIAVTDPQALARLGAASLIVSATVTTFAADPLEIAVPASNPAGIARLADLAKPGVRLVLPDPSLPLGADAAAVLAQAGVSTAHATLELQVPDILQQLVTGTADAAVVTRSDVVAGGSGVTSVAIPAAQGLAVTETAAALANSPNQSVAAAFVGYLVSAPARTILTAAGFMPGR